MKLMKQKIIENGFIKREIKMSNYVEEKSWDEFRSTGLLLIINQILHIFGWAIVASYERYDVSTDIGVIKNVYPARVKYRGFTEKSTDRAYKKITKYMDNNSKDLLDDIKEINVYE